MYFITTRRMLEVCFSAHPNIQYRTDFIDSKKQDIQRVMACYSLYEHRVNLQFLVYRTRLWHL